MGTRASQLRGGVRVLGAACLLAVITLVGAPGASAADAADGPRLLDAVLSAEEAAAVGGISGAMAPSTWAPSCRVERFVLSCQKGYYPTGRDQVFPGAYVLEVHDTGDSARATFEGWTAGDRSFAAAREIPSDDPDRRFFYLDEPNFTRVESYAVRGRLLVRVRCAGETGTAAEPMAACADRALDAQLAKLEQSFPSVVPPSAPAVLDAQVFRTTATVSWPASTNDGGARDVEYVVTSDPAGAGCRTTETTCTIRGLAPGGSYTFSVVAANPAGSSVATVSPRAIRASVPSGPVRGVRVERQGSTFRVQWKRPARLGGVPVLRYEVTSSPGGAGCETRSTSCVVRGVVVGREYRFTVVARNAAGASTKVVSAPVRIPVPAPAPVPPSPAPLPAPEKDPAQLS